MNNEQYYIDRSCLMGIVGSRAQGLSTEASDTDYMGVFIEPSYEIAGLNWNKGREQWNNQSSVGDDYTFYEIGKFMTLMLASNPTALELLYLTDYTKISAIGGALRNMREATLSESRARAAYVGVVASNIATLQKSQVPRLKIARHSLRLVRQGVRLLTTNEILVKEENPTEYFDLTRRNKSDMLSIIESELQTLKTCKSILREKPDRKAATDFITHIRKDNN